MVSVFCSEMSENQTSQTFMKNKQGSNSENISRSYIYYSTCFLLFQEEAYKARADYILHESWNVLHSPDWTLEKKNAEDTVHVLTIPGVGKVFKLTVSYLPTLISFLFRDF